MDNKIYPPGPSIQLKDSFIYILALQGQKFYIGKTAGILEQIIQQHIAGNGGEWTQKHKPTNLVNSFKSNSSFDEDNVTKEYMIKYGIDNVRGGSYTSVVLDEWQVKSLQREFARISGTQTTEKCEKCDATGHSAKYCTVEKDKRMKEYLAKFEEKEQVESEISQIEKLILLTKNYMNPYKFIAKYSREVHQYNPEWIVIVPSLSIEAIEYSDRLKSERVGLMRRLYDMYVSTSDDGEFERSVPVPLQMVVNKIYLKRRKIEEEYMASLPEEYQQIFKENGFDNIFEIVRQDLFDKLEYLTKRMVEFF